MERLKKGGYFCDSHQFPVDDSPTLWEGCPRGVMVKAMDCGIVVSEFVL